MKPGTVQFVALLVMLGSGCSSPSTPEDTQFVKEPESVAEAVAALKPLIGQITVDVAKGNPGASDAALHDAMFLANRMTSLATNTDRDSASTESSQRLSMLLMKAHNSAHGGGLVVDGEEVTFKQFAETIGSAFEAVERASSP